MSRKLMALLQEAAHVRRLIEERTRADDTNYLTLLRLKRLSLVIQQNIGELATSFPKTVEVAHARPHARLRGVRHA